MMLVIDNYDSFTYNLVQYLGELGAEVVVRRNDETTLDEIAALQPERIVISPGPGRPEDAGVSLDVIRAFRRARARARRVPGAPGDRRWRSAASVVRAPMPMHGKTSPSSTTGGALRRHHGTLSRPDAITRSIVAEEGLPDDARGQRAHARGRRLIMGLRHRDVADARRAVPSRVGPHRRGAPHAPQLPGAVVTCSPTLTREAARIAKT